MKKTILILLFVVVVGGAGYWFGKNHSKAPVVPNVEKPAPVVTEKPKPTPVSTAAEFGKPVTLKLLKKTTFSDGLVAILTSVDDSRCKAPNQCIWSGELSLSIELSGGTLKNAGEVHLGTVMTKEFKAEGYKITLNDATTSTGTITITKE